MSKAVQKEGRPTKQMENYMGVNRLCAELEGCGSLSRPYAEHECVIDSKARMLYYRRQCRRLLFVGEV